MGSASHIMCFIWKVSLIFVSHIGHASHIVQACRDQGNSWVLIQYIFNPGKVFFYFESTFIERNVFLCQKWHLIILDFLVSDIEYSSLKKCLSSYGKCITYYVFHMESVSHFCVSHRTCVSYCTGFQVFFYFESTFIERNVFLCQKWHLIILDFLTSQTVFFSF
jgi:hypothetical protein